MQVPFQNAFECKNLVCRACVTAFAARFFHKFACQSLVLAIEDGGRLFVVFALFPFADDAFFFNHAFKTLDCFFEILGIFNVNRRHNFHLLFAEVPSTEL